MSIGHPPKMSGKLYFLRSKLEWLLLIGEKEEKTLYAIALGIAVKVKVYISRAVSYFNET